ncbi:hypothetical protein [Bauldia litoralis]|uniref:hypothetical protein n=1 Tax=Bauldia litoralis TaxID=665467 RepID=UPI0032671D87
MKTLEKSWAEEMELVDADAPSWGPPREGYFDMPFELLEEMLKLPPGHKIVAVRADRFEGQHISIMVEGPSLPVTPSGGPLVRVNYSVPTNGRGEFSWRGELRI